MDWMVIWRCAPLSNTCAIDWDAWAAIATASGVLVALAAPYLANWATRRRANALFALAYKQRLVAALEHLTKVALAYYEGSGTQEDRDRVETELMASRLAQSELSITSGGIVDLAELDIDLSRWPSSVSLDLAASVASAINACRVLRATMIYGSEIREMAAWTPFFARFRRDLVVAVHLVMTAEAMVTKAGNSVIDQRLVRHQKSPLD